jgi:hypothetical protein
MTFDLFFYGSINLIVDAEIVRGSMVIIGGLG